MNPPRFSHPWDLTSGGSIARLDSMVMAGKGTPSEESVPLVCPECRSHETEQTTRGQIRLDGKPPRDTNRATCRACGITGTVADWDLIEQLRQYIGRMRGHDALASQS